jgi:hypothetical protein
MPRSSFSVIAAAFLTMTVAVWTVLFNGYLRPAQSPASLPTAELAPLPDKTAAPEPLITALTPTPPPTLTPTPPPTEPTSRIVLSATAATADAAQEWSTVLDQLNTTWGLDWPRTITLLENFLYRFPDNREALDAQHKLYAALVNYAEDLRARGSTEQSVRQLEQAVALSPAQPEARA